MGPDDCCGSALRTRQDEKKGRWRADNHSALIEAKTDQLGTDRCDGAVPSRRILLSALEMVTSKYDRPFDSNLLLPETSSQMSSLASPSRSKSQTMAKSRRLRSGERLSSRLASSTASARPARNSSGEGVSCAPERWPGGVTCGSLSASSIQWQKVSNE